MMRTILLAGLVAVAGGALAQPSADTERCGTASGTVDETIAACTRAIESKQYTGANLASLLNSRGISWREKGYDEMALADFDEAIRLNPNNAAVLTSRGNLYGDKGDNDKAIADYDAAIKLDPKLAPAYSNRGLSWLAKGDHDKALSDLNTAIRLDPRLLDAYNNRGFVWRAKREAQRAIADFSQVIKLDPKFADAYDSLALIYATSANPRVRNGRRAVELAQQACELTGWKNAYYLNTLAAAHAEAGNYSQAAEWQAKALAMKTFSRAGEAAALERLKLYQAGKPFHDQPRGQSK
jgi:tetratricopeptide (TPR) repeat protein